MSCRVFHRSLALLLLLVAGPAHAAACCVSASVFGIGRLVAWETAATGLQFTEAHDTGRWDTSGTWRAFPAGYREDELRAEAWGIFRVHERVQVFGRVPWVVGVRAATGVGQQIGQGVGDVQAGGRWDIVLPGEREHWPAIALVATVLAPTARRADEATDPLGASATGRGAWVGGLAASVEKVMLPWFVRVDAGVTVPAPMTRADLGVQERLGPGVRAALSGGRELVEDRWVLGAQLLMEADAPYTLAGVTQPGSAVRGWTGSLSVAWKFADGWTLTGTGSTDAPSRLLGSQNRAERWAGTLGVRYAWTE